jgi:hypothetical protein
VIDPHSRIERIVEALKKRADRINYNGFQFTLKTLYDAAESLDALYAPEREAIARLESLLAEVRCRCVLEEGGMVVHDFPVCGYCIKAHARAHGRRPATPGEAHE